MDTQSFHDLTQSDAKAAWDLFPDLAAVYEREIRKLARDAVKRFVRHQWHHPAPLAAASAPPPGWTIPDPDEILAPRVVANELSAKTGQLRTRIAEASTAGTLRTLGMDFNLSNPLLQGVIAKMGGKITNITESVRSDIMAEIQAGYDQGLSIRDTARLVTSKVDGIAKTRGEMIARTELTAGTSGGSWAAARMVNDASTAAGEAGMRKIWIATEDDRTREAHIEAADTYGEGQGIPIDQAFIVDGEPLMYPGDDGSPENVINCRCTIGYEQSQRQQQTNPFGGFLSGTTDAGVSEDVAAMSDSQIESALPALAQAVDTSAYEAVGPEAYDALAGEARAMGGSDGAALLRTLKGEDGLIQSHYRDRLNYFTNREDGRLRSVVSLAPHDSAKAVYRLGGAWSPGGDYYATRDAITGAVKAAAADGRTLVYAGKDSDTITLLRELGFKEQTQGGGGVVHMVLGKRDQVAFLRGAGEKIPPKTIPPKTIPPKTIGTPPKGPTIIEPPKPTVVYSNGTYTVEKVADVKKAPYWASTEDKAPVGTRGGQTFILRSEGHTFDVFIETGTDPYLIEHAENQVKILADRLTNFPPARSGLKRIGMFLGRNPGDAAAARRYGYRPGTFRSAATARSDGVMSFWNGQTIDRAGVFDHEMGHIIGQNGSVDLGEFEASDAAAIRQMLGDNVDRWEFFSNGPRYGGDWLNAAYGDAVDANANPVNLSASRYGVTSLEGHALTYGRIGVTDYGNVAIQEDWAESVRLYILQKEHGYIGYTGSVPRTRYTFEQLFPRRWAILNELLGGGLTASVGGEGALDDGAVGGVLDQLDGVAVVGLDQFGVGAAGGGFSIDSSDFHVVDDRASRGGRHRVRRDVTGQGVHTGGSVPRVSQGNPAQPVRLKPEQKDELARRAAEHGMTISDVMRAGAFRLLDQLDGKSRIKPTASPGSVVLDFVNGNVTYTTSGVAATTNSEDPMTKTTLAVGDIPVGDETDPTIQALGDVAREIVHCPDYGDAYWNADTGDVWWEACDGDLAAAGDGADPTQFPDGQTSAADVTNMFMAVDGVQTVTIMAEQAPDSAAGYVTVPESGDGGDVAPEGDESGTPDMPGMRVEADGFAILSPYDAVLTEPTGEQGDSPPAEAPVITEGIPFRATLALEGTPTDDGRIIQKGALTWRELPLTLMVIVEDSHGGMPQTVTKVAGRIDQIERVDTGEATAELIGTGMFDAGGPVGLETARLVDERFLRGVSVDLAIKQAEEISTEEPPAEGDEPGEILSGLPMLSVTEGIIMGATVCPFAAFGEADIETITAAGTMATWRIPQVVFNSDGWATAMSFLGHFDVVPVDDVPPAPTGDTGGGMIAVYPAPDEAAALADPDGNIPADGLHVTLFHFDAMPDAATLAQIVDDFATGYSTISGQVGGAGVFGGGGVGSDDTPGVDGEPEEANEPEETPDVEPIGDADVPQVLLIDAPGLGELRFDLADALEAAGIPYSELHDFTPHITTDYDDAADLQLDQTLIGKPVTFAALSIVSEDGTRADVPLSASLTASGAGLVPVHPPMKWFDYPAELDGETLVPLTVTDEGRVYGHIAAFNQCHIGSPAGQCYTAPHHFRTGGPNGLCAVCGELEGIPNHSRSGYSFFHLGEIETDEGELVRVGQLTLGTTHAPTTGTSTKMAQGHYENTGTAAVDGVVYEDNVGPFLAGALRPDMPASKIRELRAAKPSGDWRGIKGRRELIGVLAVNKPGFPIVRRSAETTEAGTRELALVAAGFPDPAAYGTMADCRDASEEIMRLVSEGFGRERVEDVIASYRLPDLLASARTPTE